MARRFRRRDFRVSGFPLRGSVPHAVLRFHLPLVEPDVRICRIRLSDGIRSSSPRSRNSFTRRLDHSTTLGILFGGSRQHGHSPSPCRFPISPEVRPLPSAGVTRFHRYYGPLRLPTRPGLSLAGVRLTRVLRGTPHHRLGSPVLRWSSCSDMPSSLPRWNRRRLRCSPVNSATAAFPISLLGRLPHCLFRGLLDVHSRYGLSARGVAQSDPFHRRLQPPRCRDDCSDCFRLEQHPCRTGFSPAEDQHLLTAHKEDRQLRRL